MVSLKTGETRSQVRFSRRRTTGFTSIRNENPKDNWNYYCENSVLPIDWSSGGYLGLFRVVSHGTHLEKLRLGFRLSWACAMVNRTSPLCRTELPFRRKLAIRSKRNGSSSTTRKAWSRKNKCNEYCEKSELLHVENVRIVRRGQKRH